MNVLVVSVFCDLLIAVRKDEISLHWSTLSVEILIESNCMFHGSIETVG